MCSTKSSSLRRVCNRQSVQLVADAEYSFVQLADPQLGLLESYVEKRKQPLHWYRELALVNRAIEAINRIGPKFVIVCGDLVNAQPGCLDREKQLSDIFSAFAKLFPSIPLFVLPGNHDIGDHPSTADLEVYKSAWGDDYYSFWVGNCKYIVVNTQLYWSDSRCPAEALAQDNWLTLEFSATENRKADNIIVFQHIPFFESSVDEPDGYFNIPNKYRLDLLHRYFDAGVRHVFSGHLHRNSYTVWSPENCSAFLTLVSSTAVGVQLGSDLSGLRVVNISKELGIQHNYYSFDLLEQNNNSLTPSNSLY